MGHMKELFGAACLGAAYRAFYPLVSPKKISVTTYTENSERREEYRKASILEGAVRGAMVALFLKGASWGLKERTRDIADRYGSSFADYAGKSIK